MKPHLKGGEIDDFKSESVASESSASTLEVHTQEQLKSYSQLRKQRQALRENPPRSIGWLWWLRSTEKRLRRPMC